MIAARALLATLTLLPGLAQAWSCELGPSAAALRWRETRSTGERFVSESGTWAGLHGRVALPLGDSWTVRLGAQAQRGTLDYAGQTSTGGSAATRVDWRSLDLLAEAAWRPTPDAAWQVRLGASQLQAHRALRSTATAAGYPERYRQTLTWLGGSWQFHPQWQLSSDLGLGTGGRNHVVLPGRDPADLPLGRATAANVALRWAPAPSWAVETSWQALRWAEGRFVPVTLQGQEVQSARQPRSEQHLLSLRLIWRSA